MAHWLRRMLHASRASEIKPGVNYRVRRTDSGTFLDIGPQTSGASGSRMFPFKVYSSGANPPNATTDWRTFRVRAGSIFFDSATPTDVTGTDGTNDDPDNDTAEVGTDRFTAPASADDFYVWIEFEFALTDEWTAAVVTGQHPIDNGWENFPALDGHHLLIAHITTSNDTDKVATIRQYLRTDVIFGPNIGICTPDGWKATAVPAAYKEEFPV